MMVDLGLTFWLIVFWPVLLLLLSGAVFAVKQAPPELLIFTTVLAICSVPWLLWA